MCVKRNPSEFAFLQESLFVPIFQDDEGGHKLD